MKSKMQDIYWLPSTVLIFLGLLDLIRGVMHTFLLTWSATHVAQLDMTSGSGDQVFLLGVFGISNFLTGFIYFLISRKARNLSPYVLIIIPLTYLLGVIGIRSGNVQGQSAFNGQYFMFVYLGICIITFVIFLVQRRSERR